MIAHLGFRNEGTIERGKLVRRAVFSARSMLPESAACLVANGMRETLQRQLGLSLEFRVAQPAVPGDEAKAALFERALVYRVGGSASDAFIVVRITEAVRLAGLAFGETDPAPRERLSSIELAALDRIACGIAVQCGAICGSVGAVRREAAERARAECTSYFEVRAAGTARFAVGFGLSREPSTPPGAALKLDDLLDVSVHARVEVARGTAALADLAALRSGDTVLLETQLDEPGALLVEGARVAGVVCGDLEGRRAATVCAA